MSEALKRRALAVSLLWPAAAQAHLVSTGIGPFYDGLAHLFVSVSDLLLCLGIGLLAGLSGRTVARRLLLWAALAWIAGAAVGLQVTGATTWTLAAPLMLTGIGLLVALDSRTPGLFIGAATVACAISGLSNGGSLAPLGFTGIVGLYAAFVAAALLTAASVVGLRAVWARIAVRVAGSWIGATGLLLLGWTMRSSWPP